MLIVQDINGARFNRTEPYIKAYNFSFKGWSCAAGLTTYVINTNGDIFGSVCKQGGRLGNVYSGIFTAPKSPIVCGKDNCYCSADMGIPKGKTLADMKKLYNSPNYPTDAPTDTPLVAMRTIGTKFHIYWSIGHRCNYDCSYCPPNIHDNHSPHMSLQKLKDGWDCVYDSVKHLESVRINFLGGEPTLHPDYSAFIEHCTNNDNVTVTTTTNGTAHISKLITYAAAGVLKISIHSEFIQREKIIKKIHQLYDANVGRINIAYMLIPGKLQEAKDFISSLPPERDNFNILVQPLVDLFSRSRAIIPYSPEELALIKG
jgi:organic radical activating enzyme